MCCECVSSHIGVGALEGRMRVSVCAAACLSVREWLLVNICELVCEGGP